MRSSKVDRGSVAADEVALDFDPDAVLLQDPGLLLDPNYLAAVHLEAGAGEGAARMLLQMGFLCGLQDALRAVADAFSGSLSGGLPVMSPPLPVRFSTTTPQASDAALALIGEWPERTEAGARLGALGSAAAPSCWLSAGYTSGWLSGTLDVDILALETRCDACGDEGCQFEAREPQAWREHDPQSARWLDALPFAALRAFVSERIDRDLTEPSDGHHFDPEAAVIHIWGPIMVIPFSGPDEAFAAIDLIGRDPAAREVSVVVVDLTGAVLDDGFGAVALEQIVDLVEAWGAEAIFAGASELSERVVADLERAPLLAYKDVSEAIAAALRIAASQRRPA